MQVGVCVYGVHLYARRCMPVTSFSECLVPKGTEPDPRGIALALRLSVPFLLDRYTHRSSR